MLHTVLARIGRAVLSLFMRQPNRDCITNDNRKVTFPSHLPDEIIIEIIQMTFEEFSSGFGRDFSPIPYIRVCKNWHRVIAATPCLWTNLSLSIRFEERRRNTKIVESAIKTWLRHSGTNPISFSFEASWSKRSYKHMEEMEEIWNTFGDVLDELIPRCRELTISSASNYHLPKTLQTQLERALHLRSLRLYGWIGRCRDWLPIILRMLPQLRECTSVYGAFTGAAIKESLVLNIPLNAPNGTLRHLHLSHYFTNVGLLLIFTQFPGLENVKIKYAPTEFIMARSQNTISLESPIILSRLSKFDITFSICCNFWILPGTARTPLEVSRYEAFQHFRFPSLTELTIDSETRTRMLTHSEDQPCVQCFDVVINGLANSIRRSDAKVSLLSLTVENESFGAFQQLFPVLPDVKVLRCNIRREEDKERLRAGITSCVDELALFIDALQDGNRASPMMFFAKLESLEIYDSRKVLQSARASSEMLAQFVRVRRTGIHSSTEPGAVGKVVEAKHDFPSSLRDASGPTSSVDGDKHETLNTRRNHNEAYSLQRLKVTEYREESEGTRETQGDEFLSLQLLKNSVFVDIIKDGLIVEYEGSYDDSGRTR